MFHIFITIFKRKTCLLLFYIVFDNMLSVISEKVIQSRNFIRTNSNYNFRGGTDETPYVTRFDLSVLKVRKIPVFKIEKFISNKIFSDLMTLIWVTDISEYL